MVKLVVFDLDGTLADTLEGIKYSTNIVISEYGLKPYDRDYYESVIGCGAKGLIENIVKDQHADRGLIAPMLSRFLVVYSQHWMVGISAYDGAAQMLLALGNSGVKIAINTNKPQTLAEQIVALLFSDVVFSSITGACDDYAKKPSADGVKMILNAHKLGDDACVYVGDSRVDVKTARNAHLKLIGVTWGYDTLENLQTADFLAHKTQDISKIINRLGGIEANPSV